MNDHCPFPNLLAYRDTSLAFARYSSSLSFVPQEMSLNIDIGMILVKFSGVLSNLNSKRLTSSMEILTQESVLSRFKDQNLTSTPCLPCK